jgi:hypothetical protein
MSARRKHPLMGIPGVSKILGMECLQRVPIQGEEGRRGGVQAGISDCSRPGPGWVPGSQKWRIDLQLSGPAEEYKKNGGVKEPL